MKLLLDNDVPDRVGSVLREAGHEVFLLRNSLPVETDDEEVLAHEEAKGAVLVTCNRDDFLELARHQSHEGIVVLICRKTRIAECAAMLWLIGRAGEQGLRCNVNFA